MSEENPWIDSNKELPPCDGNYQVSNFSATMHDWSISYYDGIGFIYENAYRNPKFWRKLDDLKKRYGKL
jgi:hypothetical protein